VVPQRSGAGRSGFVPTLLALALFWAVAVGLQWRAHSFTAEFGDHHDEPAHYVTGLMVRDYAASLASDPPMEYAQNYYLHYPKVAFGHWPPVFYVAQAAWTLPFGVSRTSVMLFLALLSAILAAAVYRVVARDHGIPAALAAGALLLTLPLIQEYGRVMMSDLLHGLLFFLAALAMGHYFRRPDWKSSVLFGLFAASAILNKGTGAALALLPVFCLVFTLRFGLLKKFSFWLSALVVVAVAGPWYAFAPNAMHQSAVPLTYVVAGPEFSPRFRADWIPLVGVVLIPPAALGIVVRVIVPLIRRQPVDGIWAATAALLVSVLGFRSITPLMADARHALPVVPAVLAFAATGTAWLLSRLPRAWATPMVVLTVFLLMLGNVRGASVKEPAGFSEAAEDLVAEESLRDSVVLVSSDAIGEGMFIAEVAMRENRPGHIVLRASKVLSTSGWMGEGYTSFFDTPDQLMEYLDGIPVGVLVLEEDAARDQAHHRLLREVVRTHADQWERIGAFEGRGGPPSDETGISLYRLVGHEGRPVGPIELDLGRHLGTVSQD
jgi:hypothetical protein